MPDVMLHAVTATGAYTVEAVDLAAASDDLLREVTAFQNEIAHERIPEDPPVSVQAFTARVRGRPKMVEMKDWIVRTPDGRVAARGSLGRFIGETNKHFREGNIDVLPQHRRKGIAKAIFGEIVAAGGGADDIVLGFYTNDRVPAGAGFLRRIGARETLSMHMNQLDLARLDRALVREWAAIDPNGYRLVRIDGDVPDSLIANVIVAYDTMNTAPRGTSAAEDWHTTADEVREFDRSRRAAGRERRLLLAVHEETGETAGYTELAYDPKVPHVMSQQGTAVIPAHRGRGIGKWIKAAMLERAVREWPAARLVRTGNADSNAAMIAINTRLGFKPAFATATWEIGIADARRYLGSAQP